MPASAALEQFVSTVSVTGGVRELPSGCYAPLADPDWIDLADAYLAACRELKIEPVIEVHTDDEQDDEASG